MKKQIPSLVCRISMAMALLTLCLLPLVAVAQTPAPPPETAAAMNAGLQHLKDSNWKQAGESFDLVLMFAPKYAPAHIGKLCAELKVTEEKLLGDLDPPVSIDENQFFKAAMESADPGYKRQIQGYADKLNERVKTMMGNLAKDDRKAGERMTLTVNGIEYAFRWCPAGTFVMGSPESEQGNVNIAKQHRVILSRGFWMLETQVTQGMWASVMGNNPSEFKGLKRPVDSVSWDDSQENIKKLNDVGAAPAGFKFALPTEAQWEYACRAGTTTAFYFGHTLTQQQANFGGNQTTEVGKYPANAWGLRDMHGNVWEWCADRYGVYPGGAVTDPTGPSEGGGRVIRGGSWAGHDMHCWSAYRNFEGPSGRDSHCGIRLALVRAE